MNAAPPAHHRVGGRVALSDPAVKKIAQASSSHNYFDELPKLQGEDDWQKWSDALQDAALMAGADSILNGESTHPPSLDDKQCTTAEWNDNIKRTAVWRRRNESLLKAMRDTMDSDAEIDIFGPLNAHKAYISLKSRYHVSDNQKAINLYNEELMLAVVGLFLVFGGSIRPDTTPRDSRHRHYRGELFTGPCDDSTVRRIKQFSPSNKVKGSVLELITATENVILGTMTLWGKGKMYATIHSSHLRGYNGGPGWIKFAGIWNEAGEHLPWREVEKLIERKCANNVAASRKDVRQGAGEERYDLVVRAEKNTAVIVKTEDEDTSMAEGEEQDETSVIIKPENADSSSDDSHDEWTDDVATTDRAVRTQEHAVRQGLVSPLHTLSGKWYFHSPDHNPGLDKDISIIFYDRQAHDISERMCAPGHCKSTPAQIHYCGELRFKAPNGERDFHCFIKQFDVPKQTSLIPVIIELWELHNKRAIFVNAWFLGAGAMRMAIPTTYIPSYQGQKTMITFSGVKYGWVSPAG